jgi:hypothetical protein
VTPLTQVVFDLDDVFGRDGIGYAIGGALALAEYAEPRATADIDVTVRTLPSSAGIVVALLGHLGWRPTTPPSETLPVAGTRFVKDDEIATIDVFFSFDDYHDVVLRNAVRRPFVNRAAGTSRSSPPTTSP